MNDLSPEGVPDMSSLKVVYEGDQHDIQADVLLDSIGSVTDVVSKINTKLGDDERDLKIRISAPERGSFGIDLSLLSEAVGIAWSAKEEISYTAGLVTILTNLYRLHKHLGADDPAELEDDADGVRVINNEGDVEVYENDVVNIYLQNEDVRNGLNGTYAATQRDDRVDGLRFEDPETGEETFRADRDEFERLSGKEEHETRTQVITTEEETVTLTRVPLDDPERRWEILWDGERVGVEVEDVGFLAQVQTGSISFRRGDRLTIDLDRKQEYNEKIEAWETTDYMITQVHEYISGGEQRNLFDDDEDE